MALTRLYKALNDVVPSTAELDWSLPYPRRFAEAMDDDFNTPLALAVLFDLTTEINRSGDAALAGQLRCLEAVLGLLERSPQQFLQSAHGTSVSADDNAQIAEKIAARIAAKIARDYATADRLRDELVAAGILLEDKPGNITEWRRA